MGTLFDEGSSILRREVLHGRVWMESPVTVISDDGDQLAILVEPGSKFTFREHPFGRHPWQSFTEWTGPQVLQLYREQTLYSVWMFFDGDCFRNWYINFEAPLVRQDGAIDTNDYGLDLIVNPDGTTRWKDVEDLHRMMREGRMTLAEISDVLRAAEQVTHELAAGERWWAQWDEWRPTLRGMTSP